MKKGTKGNIKLGAIAISMACVIVALGFGCGIGFEPNNLNGGNSGDGSSVGEVFDNGDVVIVAGAQTVATVYYEQVLPNMLSIAGLAQASQATLDSVSDKIGSFPEFGLADSINAPMMAGVVAVGSEVCGDLMQSEFDTALAQRRIFASVDFDSQDVDDAAVADMVRRMARSFWQRNETAAELTMIQTGISETAALANDNNNTQGFRGDTYRRGAMRAALATCTAMISSTSAIQL